MCRKAPSVAGVCTDLTKVGDDQRTSSPSEMNVASGAVRILAERGTSAQVPPLWNGRAARRIEEILDEALVS